MTTMASAGLSTSPTNRLKYWEKIDVSHFHDMLLRVVADPQFKPYHAQGVDMSRLTGAMNTTLTCFISKIVKDLNRHRPWVIKDPRMLLFAEQWLAQVRPHASLPRVLQQRSGSFTSTAGKGIASLPRVLSSSAQPGGTHGHLASGLNCNNVAAHLQIKSPICVIVFRDPLANAVSLADNAKKSAQGNGTQPMTVQRWLNAWEEGASLLVFTSRTDSCVHS